MWSNGFSRNLEIVPWRLFGPASRPVAGARLVSHVSGRWLVVPAGSDPLEARLVRSWVVGGVAGLTLRPVGGGRVHALLIRAGQGPGLWRRLQVRLRLPVA